MTSNTLTPRKALQSLDVNIKSTISPSNILKKNDAKTPSQRPEESSPNDANTSLSRQQTIPTGSTKQTHIIPSPHCKRAGKMAGTKRRLADIDTPEIVDEPPSKIPGSARASAPDSIQTNCKAMDTPPEDSTAAGSTAAAATPRVVVQVYRKRESMQEAQATSPASSFEDSQLSDLNDSQNTVLTEPDSPVTRVMAPEEIRQKARAMRLRLRLAAYKVSSNQIDIPISQLQIITSPPSPTLPQQQQQRRKPLPTAIPSIRFQNPLTTKSASEENIPSSPPQEPSPRKEAFATPLLPRQRQGLLNPPALGSPTWKDRDLTSSAVKGKAADSLLSLMRQDR